MTTTFKELQEIKSVFEKTRKKLFTRYGVTLQFRNKLMGGRPKHPAIIEGWLRTKTGVTSDEEIKQMVAKAIRETRPELNGSELTYDDLVKASEDVADSKQTVAFCRDGENGLYIEGRQVKSMLKESVSILFPGGSGATAAGANGRYKWGPTGKAPKGFLAETVFVEPDTIYLGVDKPDGLEQMFVHAGENHSVHYREYVVQPEISFEVWIARDRDQKHIKPENWAEIWLHAEQNGLGAARSQGYGKFAVTRWEQLS